MPHHYANDPNTQRSRIGGLVLALGSVLTVASMVTWIAAYSDVAADATPADTAAAVVASETAVSTASWLGIVGALGLTLGAALLVTRAQSTRGNFPGSSFWMFVAFGSLLWLGANLWSAGSLHLLASNFESNAIVYEALETTTMASLAVGTIAIGIGLIGAFVGENRSSTSAAPQWVNVIGLAASAVAVVAGVLMATGVPGSDYGLMSLMIALLATTYLGVRIAWPGHGSEEPQRASTPRPA